MKPNRKETYKEKLKHLQELSGLEEYECVDFIDFVYKYLNSCGYFEADFNIHGLSRPDNWIKNIDKDFGTWILDMALQYNMEQGLEYKCELIEDRYGQQ